MNKFPEDPALSELMPGEEICKQCGGLIIQTTEGPVCNCSLQTETVQQIAAMKSKLKQEAAANVAPKAAKVAKPKEAPKVEEEVTKVEATSDIKTEEQQPRFSAKEALKSLPGAPDEAQIAAWKNEHGKVYTFPFDMDEIYVWRPMRRREWQMLQSNELLVKDESKFQEQVVMRAVLWPKIDPVGVNLSRAGLVPTLFSVIMQGSYFLHPDFAISMVEEL